MTGLASRRVRAERYVSVAIVAGLALVAVSLIDVAQMTDRSSRAAGYGTVADSATQASASPAPFFGLLGPQDSQLPTLTRNSGVSVVVIGAGWQNIEPEQGVFSASALQAVATKIHRAANLGLSVVLDPGFQYPPSWAFDLPGQTRFVNQYGGVWHGGVSADVPNAVFNSSIRSAEASYLMHLGKALEGAPITRVRVGGLLSGELRYPPATYEGRADLIWDYGTPQAAAPVPGWRPGIGTTSDASRSLQFYFTSLTRYLVWLMHATRAAFPHSGQEVLFPSWGLRPGMVDDAVDAGLHNTTNAEVNGMISSGLDWPSQVAAVAHTKIPVLLSCTWLDAPSQGASIQQVPPIAFLTSLAARYGLGVMAENTGGGGARALALSVARVKKYHLRGMLYFSGSLIANGQAQITLPQYTAAARAARKR